MRSRGEDGRPGPESTVEVVRMHAVQGGDRVRRPHSLASPAAPVTLHISDADKCASLRSAIQCRLRAMPLLGGPRGAPCFPNGCLFSRALPVPGNTRIPVILVIPRQTGARCRAQLVAPEQPEPEPAVQPKQWLSHAMGAPVSSARLSMSKTVASGFPFTDIPICERRTRGGAQRVSPLSFAPPKQSIGRCDLQKTR